MNLSAGMLFVLLIFEIILLIFILIRQYIYLKSWEKLPVKKDVIKNAPLVSVIVPARNEEREIEKCILSLHNQVYEKLEIIIANDQSTDRTPEILKKLSERFTNVKIINIDTLPEGWVGKCNAIYRAVPMAGGKWVLFSDADVVHCEYTVNSALDYVERKKVDLLSLSFFKEAESIWEKAVLFYAYFAKGIVAAKVSELNDNSSTKATATGDFILINKNAYLKFGGHSHKDIRGKTVEDAALARVAKKNGLKINIMKGTHLIRVRKFHGLKEAWQGFSKMIYPEFAKSIAMTAVFSIMHFLAGLLPFILLAHIIVMGYSFLMLSLAILMSFIFISAGAIFCVKEDLSFFNVFLLPLGAFFHILITWDSAFQAKSKKGLLWKRRRYKL
ncbi:MAG: glycosyltransferase [Elusimicrobiota bacterium]